MRWDGLGTVSRGERTIAVITGIGYEVGRDGGLVVIAGGWDGGLINGEEAGKEWIEDGTC